MAKVMRTRQSRSAAQYQSLNFAELNLAVRPIRWEEIDQGLQLILAATPDAFPPPSSRVSTFLENARVHHYDLSFQYVGLWQDEIKHACLCVPQAGAAAMLFTSPPYVAAQTESPLYCIAVKTVSMTCERAFNTGVRFIQTIADVIDMSRKQLLGDAGFDYLTDLIYLARLVKPEHQQPILPAGYHWLTYAPAKHDLFRQTIVKTYQGSQDCPELERMRQPEDVLQGHMGSGIFHPHLWHLLMHDDTPVGVLLLSPLKTNDAMDLTYMALTPQARGKQLGQLMLSQSLYLSQTQGLPLLTLAVDCRNKPAYNLYKKMGFSTIVRRSVFVTSCVN